MKKLLVAVGIALMTAIPISASKRVVNVRTKQKSDHYNQTERPRAPMQIPVTVSFDDETLIVEVSTPSDPEGQVSLYDTQ